MLHTPLAGQNQFFDAKTTFCVLLSHKMYKITQKKKNHFLKGSTNVLLHVLHDFEQLSFNFLFILLR